MKRNIYIDALKGFAIILVVIGHVIQKNFVDFDEKLIFRLIYSFHMPLFMFLSGCVAKTHNEKVLKKTFVRLVLPFVSWYQIAFFLTFPKTDISYFEYILRWINSPDYGLWFLWILFLCHFTLYVACKGEKRIGLWSYAILIFIIKILPISSFGIPLLKCYLIFFISGYFFMKYYNKLIMFKRYGTVFCLLSYAFLVNYYHRTDDVYLLRFFRDEFNISAVPHMIIRQYKYLLAYCGIGASSVINEMFCRINILRITLSWIGTKTLEIYVVHQMIINIIMDKGSDDVKMILATILTISISIMISYLLKKISILSLVFYGRGKI